MGCPSGLRSGELTACLCFQGMPLCLWFECGWAYAGICSAGEAVPACLPVSVYLCVYMHIHAHMRLVLCV